MANPYESKVIESNSLGTFSRVGWVAFFFVFFASLVSLNGLALTLINLDRSWLGVAIALFYSPMVNGAYSLVGLGIAVYALTRRQKLAIPCVLAFLLPIIAAAVVYGFAVLIGGHGC